MKQKLVPAFVISVGLAVLTLSAFAQAPQTGRNMQPNSPESVLGVQYGNPQGVVQNEETELARQAKGLVRQLGEAKADADKEKIKTKLSDVLEKQFDLRQKRHTSEIEALESQVKKLKELVQKRQDNRRDIISKRLDQLQREALGLGW